MLKEFDPSRMYDEYLVKLKVRERLYGGYPANPEVMKAWIAKQSEHDDATTDAQVAEAQEAVAAVDAAKKEEATWTVFPTDDKGIYLPARCAKAMFKESCTMLGIAKAKRGSKQVLQHGFEVKALDGGDRIRFMRDGKVVAKEDGNIERPIHVNTMQGPRSALKRSDYVDGVEVEFKVWVFGTHAAETRHIGEQEIRDMLTFAQENGLGADRSQGNGKFDVEEFTVGRRATLPKPPKPAGREGAAATEREGFEEAKATASRAKVKAALGTD
jgi:hypothetical protein